MIIRTHYKTPHKHIIIKACKIQSWLLFVIIIAAIIVDIVANYQLIVAKSWAMGAVLAYLVQGIFVFISLRRDRLLTGKHRYHALMMDMYLAVVAKWLFAIICFGLIFVFVRPMNFLAFLVGFITMQLSVALSFLMVKSP